LNLISETLPTPLYFDKKIRALEKPKLKILFILKNLALGGTEVFNLQLIKYLQSRGLDIDLLTIDSKNELEEETKGLNIFDLKASSIRNSIPGLYKVLKSNNYEIVVANVWPLTLIAILLSKLMYKTKCICIEHGILSKEYSRKTFLFRYIQKISIKLLYRLSNAIVAVSRGVKEDLMGLGANDKSIKVIYNSTRPYKTKDLDSDLKEWYEFSGIKLISVANLKKEKNISNLLKAFNMLLNDYSNNISLLILGEGPLENSLKDEAKDLGILKKVFFGGKRINALDYINRSDIFVLSSDFEGFGIVLIEALSLGKTIVATRNEGALEIIKQEEIGYLCNLDDPNDLSHKIIDAIANPLKKETLIKESRKYSIDNIGEKYFKLLQNVSEK
tara:strand:- start:26457 stop:27620 length:1164 start_codon:yes stop_codon:yes gene_type:complete